jgi:hypothetical protein
MIELPNATRAKAPLTPLRVNMIFPEVILHVPVFVRKTYSEVFDIQQYAFLHNIDISGFEAAVRRLKSSLDEMVMSF